MHKKHLVTFYTIFALVLLPYIANADKIPDYYRPYAPILFDKQVYSWTEKVHITIIAPSWNENTSGIDSIGDDPERAVKISTKGHKLEPYRLVETAPNSGIFTGEVILTGFSHDATGDGRIDTQPRTGGNGPTSGFLETDRDDGLTISFEFANGVVLTQSAQIRWNEGTISFDKPSYLPDENAQIQIIDPDMNLNPEATDTIPVEISSDSDKAGIEAEATETSADSGIFVANISFAPFSKSSGNRLHAILDDVIYAKYKDRTLPPPYSTNDNLDIVTRSVLTNNFPTTDKVTLENVILADNSGKQVKDPKVGQELQAIAEIKNTQDYEQTFAYIVQVKDSSGTVVSLSWFTGSLTVDQRLTASQFWSPTEAGKYTVETFVWRSLENPIPLAEKQVMKFTIS